MRKVISIFIAVLMLAAAATVAVADNTAKKGPKLAVKGGHYEGTAKANTIAVDVSSDGKSVEVTYTCATAAAGVPPTTMTAKVRGNQFKYRLRTAANKGKGHDKGKGHASAKGKKTVALYVHGQFHKKGTVKGKVLVASCSSKRLNWKATLVPGPTGTTGSTGTSGTTGASGATS